MVAAMLVARSPRLGERKKVQRRLAMRRRLVSMNMVTIFHGYGVWRL